MQDVFTAIYCRSHVRVETEALQGRKAEAMRAAPRAGGHLRSCAHGAGACAHAGMLEALSLLGKYGLGTLQNTGAGVQVRAEIEALQGRKAEAMRAATLAQRRELEDICAAARMAPPPMPPALVADTALSGAAICAQVTFFMLHRRSNALPTSNASHAYRMGLQYQS